MAEEKATLSPVLKNKYKMAPSFAPGKYIYKGETIDLSKASLETVDAAVKKGFDVVIAIKEAKPAVKP